MRCRAADLRYKEVVNICSGMRLGFVYDVIFNDTTGQILALAVPGPCRFLGLFGRDSDYIIPWCCIRRIGEDIILVEGSIASWRVMRKKRGLF